MSVTTPRRPLRHPNIKGSIATSLGTNCDLEGLSRERLTIENLRKIPNRHPVLHWLRKSRKDDPWCQLIVSHSEPAGLGYETSVCVDEVGQPTSSSATHMYPRPNDARAEDSSENSGSRSPEANVEPILFRHIVQDVRKNIGIDSSTESVSEILS